MESPEGDRIKAASSSTPTSSPAVQVSIAFHSFIFIYIVFKKFIRSFSVCCLSLCFSGFEVDLWLLDPIIFIFFLALLKWFNKRYIVINKNVVYFKFLLLLS